MLAIETRGLGKTFTRWWRRDGLVALQGVDLALEQGAAFGLIGPNGAGKTTFIKLLLGVSHPSAGSVHVLGGSPLDPAVRARVGYLPERLQLPPAWSAREFLASVARLKGLARERAQVDKMLERVGLAGDGHRRVGTFSKGMRQRLALGAALLGAPDLLVLDEPTDGIDPLGRMEVRTLLAEERARGATLFLNSHLLSETERTCDRVGILVRGQLLRVGGLEELQQVRPSWRVRFAAGIPEDVLGAAGFTPEAGAWRVTASSAGELNACLDRARAAGALLLELSPDSRDLEDVLKDALEAAPCAR